MTRFSRRSFLAGSAAMAASARPTAAFGQTADVDVAIVGAGAAGIAAARRLIAAKRRVVVLEASERVGGRCVTDTQSFGVPFDRGAHWIHAPDFNPLAKLAPSTGLDIYHAPQGQKLRIGRRNAREGELEDFLANMVRANRAISEAARGKTDISCAQALPNDLADWRPPIDFVLGPFGCAKNLEDVSAFDFAKSAERDVDAFCRQGFGALLAKLGDGVPVRLVNPVTRIDTQARSGVEIESAKGRLRARHVIVTASTAILASGRIKFAPDLPKRHLDAAVKLSLGSYDHIAIEFEGNALGLQSDELVFEKSGARNTAAILANVSRSSLCLVEVGGSFGKSLAAQGERAMVAFAADWLAGLFGNDIKKVVKRTLATQWNKEPWTLGAFSAAAVGGQPGRRVLMEPVRERVWFAGEAAHETLWGTVGGAWESGERAADAVLKRLQKG